MKGDSFEEIKQQTTSVETLEASEATIVTEDEISKEIESEYQKAIKFMESISCMTACIDKVRMYKKVTEQFVALSGYKDSEIHIKQCKRNAKKAKEAIKKIIYDRAQFHKTKSKTTEDFKQTAAEFRKVKGYLDADELAELCDLKSISMERRGIKKTFFRWGMIVLCILLLVIGLKTSFPKYMIANLSMTIGSYHLASGLYENLGSYMDSEEKLLESKYQYGLKLEAKGEYTKALTTISDLGDYKDSLEREVDLEKLIIKNGVVGKTVSIGKTKWKILEYNNNQVLLLKTKALTDISYHNVPENITWETSQLREFLNSEYRSDTFSKQEQNSIVLTTVTNSDNTVYGTDGGSETEDYLFVLSMQEAQTYSTLLPTMNADTWLRTPGTGQNCAAFLSSNGKVMEYGYDVSGNQMTALPAMWFNYGDK